MTWKLEGRNLEQDFWTVLLFSPAFSLTAFHTPLLVVTMAPTERKFQWNLCAVFLFEALIMREPHVFPAFVCAWRCTVVHVCLLLGQVFFFVNFLNMFHFTWLTYWLPWCHQNVSSCSFAWLTVTSLTFYRHVFRALTTLTADLSAGKWSNLAIIYCPNKSWKLTILLQTFSCCLVWWAAGTCPYAVLSFLILWYLN